MSDCVESCSPPSHAYIVESCSILSHHLSKFLTFRVISPQLYHSGSQFLVFTYPLALYILPSWFCILPHFPHLATLVLITYSSCSSRLPLSLHLTRSFEITTHIYVMLLGTLHLAFSYSSHRAVSFGHILSCTPRWFDRYSSSIWSFKSLLEKS